MFTFKKLLTAFAVFVLLIMPQAKTASSATFPLIVIKSISNLETKVGQDFFGALEASGGIAPYTWEITAGALPSGLALSKPEQPACALLNCGNFIDNKINITGSAKEPGNFLFTLTATDSQKNSGNNQFQISVTSAPRDPASNSITIKVATDKQSYNEDETVSITISATNISNEAQTLGFSTGCQTSYAIGNVFNESSIAFCTLALTQVTLKPGETKTWNTVHDLFKYPILPGTYQLTGSVIGYGSASTTISIIGRTTPQPREIKINSGSSSLSGEINKPYSIIFRASGGELPYKFSVKSGKVPTGMTLQTTTCNPANTSIFACTEDIAVLSGTPSEAGTFTYEISATDKAGFSGSNFFTSIINSRNYSDSLSQLTPGQSTFKLEGNPTIYFYTQEKYKQAYTSMAMLRAWNVDPNKIIKLPTGTELPQDDPFSPIVKLPNGILVKASRPLVYLVENNKLRPFISLKAFLSNGYKFRDVIVFPDSDLKSYEIGEPIK